MAEDNGQEKTEQATPKRREDARRKGQVTRSRELTTMMLLMVAAVTMFGAGGEITSDIADIMRQGLTLDHEQAFDSHYMGEAFITAIESALVALVPLFVAAFVTALLAPMLLGGWNLSLQSLRFDPSKLSPMKGFKRMFSINSVVELLKAIAKFVVVLSIAMVIIWQNADDVMRLGISTGLQGLTGAGDILARAFLLISAATIVIAAVDVPYQIWSGAKKLRMTRQELKDESKNTDGNPEIKRRVREVQQEMASRRMMEAVPQADVVIVNPTHYAVALQYDAKSSGAPRLVASGGDLLAMRIRAVAAEHAIPVVRAPALARSIYHHTRIGDEIPEGLFVAVARVLAFVYRIRRGPVSRRQEHELSDLPIPEDLRFDP